MILTQNDSSQLSSNIRTHTHARTYAHTQCPMSDPLAGGNGTESILLEANNLTDVFITDLIYFHLQPGKKD